MMSASKADAMPSEIREELKKLTTLDARRLEVSGRPHADLDSTLDGIWWILCTGSMWNQLPRRLSPL